MKMRMVRRKMFDDEAPESEAANCRHSENENAMHDPSSQSLARAWSANPISIP